MGAAVRQGPHQGAQKSTRTGTGEFRTAESSWAPVTARGSPETSRSALHLPQTGAEPGGAFPMRFRAPQRAQRWAFIPRKLSTRPAARQAGPRGPPPGLPGRAAVAYQPGMPRVDAIEIVEDRTASSRCDEGFLHVRRYRALNRRVDGTRSAVYRIDVLDRPSLDAVAVCLWARTPRGVEVLLRRQLRPAVLFRRGKVRALPEAEPLLYEEIVAGLVEPGEQGLRRPAAAGGRRGAGRRPGWRSTRPGWRRWGRPSTCCRASSRRRSTCSRRRFLAAPQAGAFDAPQEGDGSPLEEGATLLWRGLDEAIAACESGEIEDAKSELAFRRLRDRLR